MSYPFGQGDLGGYGRSDPSPAMMEVHLEPYRVRGSNPALFANLKYGATDREVLLGYLPQVLIDDQNYIGEFAGLRVTGNARVVADYRVPGMVITFGVRFRAPELLEHQEFA